MLAVHEDERDTYELASTTTRLIIMVKMSLMIMLMIWIDVDAAGDYVNRYLSSPPSGLNG